MSEAQSWYDEQQPGIGSQFLAVLDRTVERIAEAPLAFPRVSDETRRALMGRFPYAVYYEVLEDVVLVLRVVHTQRDPRHWQK